MAESFTIAPELEEGGKPSGSLMAHTEGTTSLTSIERTLDVVLEDTRGAVVCESLTQLNHGHQEGRLGQWLSYFAQGAELLCSWSNAAQAVVLFDIYILQRAHTPVGESSALVVHKLLLDGHRVSAAVASVLCGKTAGRGGQGTATVPAWAPCLLAWCEQGQTGKPAISNRSTWERTEGERCKHLHLSKWNGPPF